METPKNDQLSCGAVVSSNNILSIPQQSVWFSLCNIIQFIKFVQYHLEYEVG